MANICGYLFVFSVFLLLFPNTLVGASTDGYRRVCYYTNWSQYRWGIGKFMPGNIDATLCTHLIYAFAKVKDNEIKTTEWNDGQLFQMFSNIRNATDGLKTLIAVGGWKAGSTDFSAMVATDNNRRQFIESVLRFVEQHGFDGLDLDWEYPAQRGGKPEDKANFALLVKELAEAFSMEASQSGKSRLLLTAAVPVGKENIDIGYDIPAISRHLDFINLMTYDLHGSWETQAGFNSPLYPRETESDIQRYLNVEWTANYWANEGAPKHKLIIGMATYGRSFQLADAAQYGVGAATTGPGRSGKFTGESGFLSYYEICAMQDAGEGITHWDTVQRVPYLVNGRMWVGFDNIRSLTEKTQWLVKEGYGGFMIWTLDLDDFNQTCQSSSSRYPLITAINTALAHAIADTSSGFRLDVPGCPLIVAMSLLPVLLSVVHIFPSSVTG